MSLASGRLELQLRDFPTAQVAIVANIALSRSLVTCLARQIVYLLWRAAFSTLKPDDPIPKPTPSEYR